MSQTKVIVVPQENANDDKSVLLEWYFKPGEKVEAGEAIAEMENAKSSFDVISEDEGFIYYLAEPKTKFNTGEPLACICATSDQNGCQDLLKIDQKELFHISILGSKKISAKARKLMKKYNLEETHFQELEQIKLSDVEAYISQNSETTTTPIDTEAHLSEIELSTAKIFEKKLLRQSWNSVMPSTVSIAINLQKAMSYEKNMQKNHKGINLGEIITYEAAQTLKTFPTLNAYSDHKSAYHYEHIDIGFAINLDKGLKVPVIKQADQLDPGKLSLNLKDLCLKYMMDQLSSEQLGQASFTVTSLFSLGVQHFIPVVNYKQSAILGICAPDPTQHHFQLVMSFDHQLSDGMEAAKFLNQIKNKIEA